MKASSDGNAIVYCQGAYGTPNGKTAHGLVRRTQRYRVVGVLDRRWSGEDAGEVLDGVHRGIPVFDDLEEAIEDADHRSVGATRLVMGLAPDGGRLEGDVRQDVLQAIELGLHVDSGLHDFLNDDPELVAAARKAGVTLRDVRRPPDRKDLHFFTGRIQEVASLRIAVLGTDSAVGKRTTAWMLLDAARRAGKSAELIGTGQTAWMQGVRYGILLDSMVNDFLSGEIEHAVLSAWDEAKPDVLFLEGQGSLLNPAYPGGYELLAAGRPHGVVLQHAPARKDYDGFPGFALHPIERQIEALEVISSRPVVAITVNQEDLETDAQLDAALEDLRRRTGLPVCAPLRDGVEPILEAVLATSKAVPGGRPS
jgi:uncharacterized NAD-dependent epimerase/dehydratase family protein